MRATGAGSRLPGAESLSDHPPQLALCHSVTQMSILAPAWLFGGDLPICSLARAHRTSGSQDELIKLPRAFPGILSFFFDTGADFGLAEVGPKD